MSGQLDIPVFFLNPNDRSLLRVKLLLSKNNMLQLPFREMASEINPGRDFFKIKR